jgi:hypothetical protein
MPKKAHTNYVIVYGNVEDGHIYVGPFKSFALAKEYLDSEPDYDPQTDPAHIVGLDVPAKL